jgi:AcrR family transcriptional regulator
MRRVAAQLGCSPTAIYQHFASKEDLLLALKLQAGDLLAEEMERARQEPSLEEQLRAMAHRYLEFGLQNPGYYRLLFQDVVPAVSANSKHLIRMRRAWSIMRDVLAAWIETRSIGGMVADQEANIVWAIVHGITSLALSNRLAYRDGGELHALLDLALGHWAGGLLNGLSPIFLERSRDESCKRKAPSRPKGGGKGRDVRSVRLRTTRPRRRGVP